MEEVFWSGNTLDLDRLSYNLEAEVTVAPVALERGQATLPDLQIDMA